MNIKVPKRPNIIQILIIYIIGVLYIQIAEIWLPFSITKFWVLLLLTLIIYGSFKKKIKIKSHTIISVIIGIIYIFVYYMSMNEVFGYVYPPVIIASLAIIMLDNLPEYVCDNNWNIFNICIFGYLALNGILWITRCSACFQLAGSHMQFKGALPHSNMFGAIMLSLFVVLFWQKSLLSGINKILLIAFTMATYSRTYILLIILCAIINLVVMIGKRIPLYLKFSMCGITIIIFGMEIFELLIKYVPAFARFGSFQFTGNGRQYLKEAYHIAVNSGSIGDKFIGIPMVNTYLNSITISFSHSFTENSFMGIFLLFGIVGIATASYCIYRLFQLNHESPQILILLVCVLSLMTQDTLLSVQTGIIMIFAIICMFCMAPSDYKVKKWRVILNEK